MTDPSSKSALRADPGAGPRKGRNRASALQRRPQAGLRVGGESLETLYRRWAGLRDERAELVRSVRTERTRIEDEGAFLLGTVRAAREVSSSAVAAASPPEGGEDAALAPSEALLTYVREAEVRMAGALEALEERAHEQQVDVETQLAVAQADVLDALERHKLHAVPAVTLRRRALAGGRAILHLDRPEPDAAMLLVWLLAGKPATHYGFLFDEVLDNPQGEPATLYASEGIEGEALRPSPATLRGLLEAHDPKALPVRGIIPFLVPLASGARALVQLRCRGPILELEWEEGAGFRSILTAAEAEAAAGCLLRLQLQGQVVLHLSAG